MTRKELAQQVFGLIKRVMPEKKSNLIWIAIAETDDESLFKEYNNLLGKNYALKSKEDKDVEIINMPTESELIKYEQMNFTESNDETDC